MTLHPGCQLGTYQIRAPLGSGGMGEVYLARDTRLDREVAIKLLPEHLARDRERVLRFEREAKLLASLNHPNIAAVYGFETIQEGTTLPPAVDFNPGEAAGLEGAASSDHSRRLKPAAQDVMHFLVLEYVEGETLAQRLKVGPMPVDEALEVGKQIAEALEAAHDKGVVHRDLKPGNVMVTPDGKVKVLDFGLAKAIAEDSTLSAPADSPTITADYTRPGVMLGTAPYMSPEQARGRSVDKRTDIWAFGVILYEMLTGIGPFRGETTTDSIGAILHKDVDLGRLPPGTPPMVRHIVRRCLERDRTQRLQAIGDARIELEQTLIAPGDLLSRNDERITLFSIGNRWLQNSCRCRNVSSYKDL